MKSYKTKVEDHPSRMRDQQYITSTQVGSRNQGTVVGENVDVSLNRQEGTNVSSKKSRQQTLREKCKEKKSYNPKKITLTIFVILTSKQFEEICLNVMYKSV
jgi:hypothetical protein